MFTASPHHIIAIGASAGGMEEINTFFDHTPLDGVSYVIIQHLSPNFKSRMVELLAKHSKLTVEQAEEGMLVESNRVYLIPSDKLMTIKNSKLYLTDKEKTKGPHLTINTFFKSLAEDSGQKAIGIVLSGLGSDGSDGIRAIKSAGGMVMVRNPETSEFNSMPAHAIGTGLVDFVLEPSLMPGAIEDYVKNEGTITIEQHDDEKNLKEIIELIKQNSTLDFSDYKLPTILRRTKRRASYGNFSTLGNYLHFLKANPEELEALSKEFLISVTSFFRDKDAFECLENEILPDIIKNVDFNGELKIWVAGCATGEEAYSIAILIAEQLTGNLANTIVKIFATDIDSAALIHAGKAVYSKSIENNVSANRLEKYFVKEGDNYRVKPVIRKMLIFAQHDLVKNPPYCNMDLISCRNLMIYMAPVLQKKVFAMLLFGLKKDGYLFLGSSENPLPIIKSLEVTHKKWKIYKNLETKRGLNLSAFSMPDIMDTKRNTSHSSRDTVYKDTNFALLDAMHESLASSQRYFSVCINENNEVIRSYGDSTKYLLNKHFSSDLVELLPKPLAVAFNILSRQVLKSNEAGTIGGINIKQLENIIKVSISISPLLLKEQEKMLQVTFSKDNSVTTALSNNSIVNEKIYLDRYVVNLEEELKELKNMLSSSNEKIDASNENMHSFNEELISANEEMQSTNEEMQSVNEELHTINTDYQLKNKELLEINDDLNNYFRSNVNGQLFIDNDLRLMKFSPSTTNQINLRDSDIGRPLSNISTNIKFETIIDDVKRVLTEGCVITKEIETNDGKWYQMMTMPYIQQADDRNNGAIITFNEITELKKVLQELNISSKMLGLAIDSADIGIWSINLQTQKFTPSPRLRELFGFQIDDAISYEETISRIDSQYQTLVTDAFNATMTHGIKCDVEFQIRGIHDGKLIWLRAVGDLSHEPDDKIGYFTGVLLDITIHKQDEIRKNDFIAMVSHELRTPITLLQAYIQMLTSRAQKANDEFNITSLEKAHRQVKKMNTMINGFLNVASFEAGKIYLNLQVFDIDALMNEIVEEASLLNTTHEIVLHKCPVLNITADRDKVGQVINNFLSNAVKYATKGSRIELDCVELDGMVQISVQDQGDGIKPKDQARIFERYYRIENENSQTISGFGLGLYLSAEIIQRHHGKVWVDSTLGKGSTFYFSLPLNK